MTNKFLLQNHPFITETRGNFILFSCDYDKCHYHRNLFKELRIRYPSSLRNSVAKRESEYLAGRFVAMFALRKLGVVVDDIMIGKNRAPIWPDAVVGSITHTGHTALCAVGLKKSNRYLGIDLEDWINSEMLAEVSSQLINQKEQLFLKNSNINYQKALTLVFSAKESLFKALYPLVGDYFDFDAVEIFDISMESCDFEMKIVKNLGPLFPIGSRVKGCFHFSEFGVLTYVSD